MAMTALCPWPTTPVATATAVACLKDALKAAVADDDRIASLGAAASALVERHAPGAPQAVKTEATIRVAGWMRTSAHGDLVPISIGEIHFQWRPTIGRNALRQSGAAGLLAPWHRPRATVIE